MSKNILMKNITNTVWILSFVSLFTDMASEMLYPILPIYLKTIGFSIVLIGILEGVAEAVAGLSKGYFGKLSDNSGKLKMSPIRLRANTVLPAPIKTIRAIWQW